VRTSSANFPRNVGKRWSWGTVRNVLLPIGALVGGGGGCGAGGGGGGVFWGGGPLKKDAGNLRSVHVCKGTQPGP